MITLGIYPTKSAQACLTINEIQSLCYCLFYSYWRICKHTIYVGILKRQHAKYMLVAFTEDDDGDDEGRRPSGEPYGDRRAGELFQVLLDLLQHHEAQSLARARLYFQPR